MSTVQTCPKCSTTFTCGVAQGQSHCWCMDLPTIPKEIISQEISKTGGDPEGCLCPACLKALAKAAKLITD
ncbi:MAG: cysteine-rich CWC family protein [Polynucleobacter victoriensis]